MNSKNYLSICLMVLLAFILSSAAVINSPIFLTKILFVIIALVLFLGLIVLYCRGKDCAQKEKIQQRINAIDDLLKQLKDGMTLVDYPMVHNFTNLSNCFLKIRGEYENQTMSDFYVLWGLEQMEADLNVQAKIQNTLIQIKAYWQKGQGFKFSLDSRASALQEINHHYQRVVNSLSELIFQDNDYMLNFYQVILGKIESEYRLAFLDGHRK